MWVCEGGCEVCVGVWGCVGVCVGGCGVCFNHGPNVLKPSGD